MTKTGIVRYLIVCYQFLFDVSMLLQLLKDYRNLRRSFMKRDTAGEGYLSVNDLLKCLQDSGVQVTQNDLQVLTAHFDTTLKGRVSYKDFINKLITVWHYYTKQYNAPM